MTTFYDFQQQFPDDEACLRHIMVRRYGGTAIVRSVASTRSSTACRATARISASTANTISTHARELSCTGLTCRCTNGSTLCSCSP